MDSVPPAVTIRTMNTEAPEYRIGVIVKVHGVKGEVVIAPTTDDIEARFGVGEVLHGRKGRIEGEYTVDSMRPHQDRLLVRFAEVPDRTEAEKLVNMEFYAPPLPHNPEEDGYYDHELEGLTVVRDSAPVGTVTGVLHQTAQPILVITIGENPQGLPVGNEALVPFVEALVPEVDLDAGTVRITPPEGLLEL